MRWNQALPSLALLIPINEIIFTQGFQQTCRPSSKHYSHATSGASLFHSGTICRMAENDFAMEYGEDDNDDDEEEEEEDPYTTVADSEFQDKKSNTISTLSGSSMDWGGELGKLRQRMGDIESGNSKDPSTALFRLMSSSTPNQLIGQFVSGANPKVVKACSDAVNSLLGGLSSPAMGIETIVKTNGEKIGSLCFQLQMTGYMFRNAEYVIALKEMMNLKGSATLEDYKVSWIGSPVKPVVVVGYTQVHMYNCQFQDAFDRLDSNDSGFIEVAEVRSLLDNIYEGKAPRFEVEAFVQFFDTNKDGKISWSEFEQGLGSAMAARTKSTERLNLPAILNDDDDSDGDTLEFEPEVSGKFCSDM